MSAHPARRARDASDLAPAHALRGSLRRSHIVALLGEIGPLLLEASRAADRDPSEAQEPLSSVRDKITRALARCR